MNRLISGLLVAAFLCLLVPGVMIAQWVQTSIPPALYIGVIAVNGGHVFVGTDSAVYLSTDGGLNWVHPQNSGMQDREIIYAFAFRDSFVFAGSASNGVFRSSNLGTSWQRTSSGIESYQIASLLVRDSVVFVGTDHGVYRSTSDGANWLPANGGMGNSYIRALAALSDESGGSYLVAASGGGVFRSGNFGASWQRANVGLTDSSVYALAAGVGSKLYAATFGHGVFRSSNYGTSWQQINAGLGDLQVISLAADSLGTTDSAVFAGTWRSGLYASTNNGANWGAFGLGGKEINAVAVSRAFVFAGIFTNGGVWRRPYSNPTAVDDAQSDVPLYFTLIQNYPNPFNPTTTITYAVSHEARVSLKVYNILGEQVRDLVGEVVQPGFHTVTFDATDLSSGIYFCKLQAGTDVSVKKMILMR